MVCSPWIVEEDLIDCGCPTGDLSAAQLSEIISSASEYLYRKSAFQYPGECSETVRPCRCLSCSSVYGWETYPALIGGQWFNYSCGCAGMCGCEGAKALRLRSDTSEIVSILIDGVAFSDYRLDAAGILWRTDGQGWPCCQNIATPSSEIGTFEISYIYGGAIPEGATYAARAFVSELVKACAGDASCRLPAGTASVTRRGVSINFSALEGRTGLYEVDIWLDSVNPQGIRRPTRILSPDDVRFYRQRVGS